jgi:hypothetical protein
MAKRQLHKLSAREAETIAKPGRHGDGGGLYLAIEAGAHGRRQWVFLYRVRGSSKRRELGLGPAKGKGKDGLSLADARLKAADARKIRRLFSAWPAKCLTRSSQRTPLMSAESVKVVLLQIFKERRQKL